MLLKVTLTVLKQIGLSCEYLPLYVFVLQNKGRQFEGGVTGSLHSKVYDKENARTKDQFVLCHICTLCSFIIGVHEGS